MSVPVRMLPGAHRPEGALAWLNELVANGEVRGVIVIAVDANGDIDPRVFGEVRCIEVAWAGARLTDHALHGE